MIAPARTGWFTWLFARHARSRLHGTFGRIQLSGRDGLRAALEAGPVLLVANHTTWWDPLVALWLTSMELHADAYAMMDAANLRRLPFFAKVGAFGVDLRDRRDGARAIRFAAGLLDRPRRLVVVYPEGRERSPFVPLELRPGAAAIARLARCPIVPVATRFAFGAEERPELWIAIGDAVPAEADLAAALQESLARIDHAVDARSDEVARAQGFEVVHRAAPGFLGRAAERMLVGLTRLF